MKKRALHVGCGLHTLAEHFPDLDADEVRLDIDPGVQPDIVASLTDLGDIGTFDIVYSSHVVEHLYPHEVPVAFSEFRRVLRPGGMSINVVPDLEDVVPTDEVIYICVDGNPIRGIDLFYGYGPALPHNPYMAHHTGFMRSTLEKALLNAGFERVMVTRHQGFQLIGIGFA